MKKIVFLSLFALCLPWTLVAQSIDDDLYYTPSKNKEEKKEEVKQEKKVAAPVEEIVVKSNVPTPCHSSPKREDTMLTNRTVPVCILATAGWLTTSFPSEQATRWDSTYPSHGNSASTSSPYITTSRRTRIGESTWESAGDTVLSISTVTMPC